MVDLSTLPGFGGITDTQGEPAAQPSQDPLAFLKQLPGFGAPTTTAGAEAYGPNAVLTDAGLSPEPANTGPAPATDAMADSVTTFDQWKNVGGPDDWDLFRAHMRAIGQADPGEQPGKAVAPSPQPSTISGMPGVAAPGTPEHAAAVAERDRQAAQQGPVSTTPAASAPAQPAASATPPAAAPLSTPGQPVTTQQQNPQRPETPQDVWILPDGRMVQPDNTKTPPIGTVRVKLTPSQIRGATSPTPANAPLDPGKALATPSAGQLAVDSRPVTLAGTPLGQMVNSKPLDAVAMLQVRRTAGSGVPTEVVAQSAGNMVKGIAQGIASGGNAGTDAMLNDVARMAWYRQVGGFVQGAAVTPEEAPKDYIESWKGAWRTGAAVPLGAALDQQLIDNGVVPPSAKSAMTAAVRGIGTDPTQLNRVGTGFAKAMAVQRLAQGERGQYTGFSDAEFNAWKGAACSGASFAEMVNAANPGRNMTVGEAVKFLQSKNLIDTQSGLLRGADFTDISNALDEAIGRDATFSVNFTSPDVLRKHFADGGGAIMFTGPSTAVWGVPHIYVVTGAGADGVTIVDSSAANKTSLSWEQWSRQTALPGMGAGAALYRTEQGAERTGTAVYATNDLIAQQAIQKGGGGVVTAGSQGTGSTRAKEEGTGGVGRPSAEGGRGSPYTDQDVRQMQRDVIDQAPDVTIRPGMSFEERVRAWQPMISWIQQRTGLAGDVVAGILYAENRFGESNLSANHNNYFSMEYNPTYDTYASGSADGRFANYATPKAAVARFLGVLAHPENTYNTRASLWAQRENPEAVIQSLVKGGYIVDEQGFPVSTWINNVHQGMQTYRQLMS